jgi:arginyl-tRNA synthetase
MSIDQLSAHILSDYLYRVAQEFSAFYNRCHILSEENVDRRTAWLNLCAATYDTLTYGLSLMGIDVPDRM